MLDYIVLKSYKYLIPKPCIRFYTSRHYDRFFSNKKKNQITFFLIVERRRIQQNDPEVQTRHRDLVTRLKNNYSTSSIGRSSGTDREDESNSSRTNANTSIQAEASSSRYNFLSKSSIDSYKSKLSSTLPSFLSKKPNSNGDLTYFCF